MTDLRFTLKRGPQISFLCSLTCLIFKSWTNLRIDPQLVFLFFFSGAEEKTNVELIVPIGSVVIAMFFWLLVVFVIRGRKRVRTSSPLSFLCHAFPLLDFPSNYAEGNLTRERDSNMNSENTHSSTHTEGAHDWLVVICLALRGCSPLYLGTTGPLSAPISHVHPQQQLGPFYWKDTRIIKNCWSILL